MSAELFNESEIPFNLAGELIDNSTTAEGEARVRALAESEARKAQQAFPSLLESAEQERLVTISAGNPDLIGHCKTYPFCPLYCDCRL